MDYRRLAAGSRARLLFGTPTLSPLCQFLISPSISIYTSARLIPATESSVRKRILLHVFRRALDSPTLLSLKVINNLSRTAVPSKSHVMVDSGPLSDTGEQHLCGTAVQPCLLRPDTNCPKTASASLPWIGRHILPRPHASRRRGVHSKTFSVAALYSVKVAGSGQLAFCRPRTATGTLLAPPPGRDLTRAPAIPTLP